MLQLPVNNSGFSIGLRKTISLHTHWEKDKEVQRQDIGIEELGCHI